MMNEPVVTTKCSSLSKSRWCLIIVVFIFFLLFSMGMIILALASLKPCLFVRCHVNASQCINRSPFKAQCICDAGRTGNGRTVCDECGIKLDRPQARIIGGSDVNDNSWPFAVLVRQHYKNQIILNNKSYTVSSSWICGGTLINHKTILTAAHCLKTEGDVFDYQSMTFEIVWNQFHPNLESTLEVSVGLHSRREKAERRDLKVIKAIRHPSYNDRYLWNDIAILQLDEYLRPSTKIQFACLTDSFPETNTTGTVVGFGDTIPGANTGSSILQQVNLTIYPDEFCTNVSPTTRKNWLIQLCSGDLSGTRDTCQGDSGGGLYTTRSNDINRVFFTVDGIVSYGEQCASPMKAGIYTRVSSFVDWIREHSDFDFKDE